jgi:hypothetical protein
VGDAALFRVGSSASNHIQGSDSLNAGAKYDFLLPSLSGSLSKSKSRDDAAWNKGKISKEVITSTYDFSKLKNSNFVIDWLGMIPMLAVMKARGAFAGIDISKSEDGNF